MHERASVDRCIGLEREAVEVYGRSDSLSSKDPTHQHPQRIPPQVIEAGVSAGGNLSISMPPVPALMRRDATKCLDDGTCADGR